MEGEASAARAAGAGHRTRGPGRLRSLDGLRGVAAVVVLIHHTVLTVPVLSGAYYGHGPQATTQLAPWLFTYTPLHVVWAGGESVDLFFVLSGLVLVLPALTRTRRQWLAYYPQRLLRLYVPVAAAVLLGYALVLAVPRTDVAGLGAWIAHRPTEMSAAGLVHDLTLVDGVSGLVSTLWSLQWEVLFSLLLPVFVLVALMLRRLPALELVLVAGLMLVGGFRLSGSLMFLPIFAIGAAMAVGYDALGGMAARIDRARRPGLTWAGVTTGAVLLFTSYWWLQAFGVSQATYAVSRPLIVAEAALLVFVGAFWDVTRRLLETPSCQWLGALSFSLYLVHEPIVIAMSILLGPQWRWLAMIGGVALALAAAVAFRWLVERPSHRWARAVGTRMSSVRRHAAGTRPLGTGTTRP